MKNPPPHNDDLSIADREPGGEDNLHEFEIGYNPLRYCYMMNTTIESEDYELAVKFSLQTHHKTEPLDFTDPQTGKQHKVELFPVLPENALEPEQGPEPELYEGYQIGENPYYLVPTLHRVKNLSTGKLLTREEAQSLVTPDHMQRAISEYADKVAEDPRAPAILAELLIMWIPGEEWQFLPRADSWYDETQEQVDEDDEYYT